MVTTPRIAVALDRFYGWHTRFMDALERARSSGAAIEFELVDLDRHDWIPAVTPFDAVLCKSPVMGRESSAHFKEKVYFLETHLGKVVFPNFKTVWHYDSKIAQSYVFTHAGVPTPPTFASFEYHDAVRCLDRSPPPYVFKGSAGAGSEEVWLVKSLDSARKLVEKTFAYQLWREARRASGTAARALSAARLLGRPWMRRRVVDRLLDRDVSRPVYWQQFVDGNPADLRVTVIGRRHACAFWRGNRPNDFRASGSGLIDYSRLVPDDALKLCFELTHKMDYDSMAFDLLVHDNKFVVIEMSYLYLAEAIANAPGIYERGEDGSVRFVLGQRWPQELWVEALLTRLRVPSAGAAAS